MPKITLEDLAKMINNGFNGVQKQMDERFGVVDKRFDSIDKRFDRLEKENELAHLSIHTELGSIWKELKAMNEKLDNLSKRTFEDSELAFREIMAMKKRLSFLEKEVEKLKIGNWKLNEN